MDKADLLNAIDEVLAEIQKEDLRILRQDLGSKAARNFSKYKPGDINMSDMIVRDVRWNSEANAIQFWDDNGVQVGSIDIKVLEYMPYVGEMLAENLLSDGLMIAFRDGEE